MSINIRAEADPWKVIIAAAIILVVAILVLWIARVELGDIGKGFLDIITFWRREANETMQDDILGGGSEPGDSGTDSPTTKYQRQNNGLPKLAENSRWFPGT